MVTRYKYTFVSLKVCFLLKWKDHHLIRAAEGDKSTGVSTYLWNNIVSQHPVARLYIHSVSQIVQSFVQRANNTAVSTSKFNSPDDGSV
jgi:hypothetical protein